ncbi:uncharacterized protein LOC143270739 [Peromyscus maniculatus bairdii]|uniref:uncharacterized protein LOC143270739 n=1 Tax=Peromyscus maniculatus bairdii TaxID=230844 RepID=UPI003FD0BFF7
MSAVAERDLGFPDPEQEGGRMDHDAGQSVLNVLTIREAGDDIDGTTGCLGSQAVSRAILGEEPGQEEIWPDTEEICTPVEEVWPDIKDIWPDVEDIWHKEVWPDIEEDLYVCNSDQENEVVLEEAEEDQDCKNVKKKEDEEEEEEEDNQDDDYEYEKKGEDEVEDQGMKIILHANKGKGSHG